MEDVQAFRRELQRALMHLYDPDYQFTEQFCTAIGCNSEEGPGVVQTEIIRMIDSLKSDSGAAPYSRIRRGFEVLRQRFVLGLTQAETAECLHMSVRSVQRAQREAIHMLTMRLLEHSRQAAKTTQEVESQLPTGSTEWVSQVKQEILSLQKSAPDAECELGAVIRGALRIAHTITSRSDVTVEAQDTEVNIRARIHPSALRQILLAVIAELGKAVPSGQITLSTDLQGDRVLITITACPASGRRPADLSLARELLSMQGGVIQLLLEDDRISVTIELPHVAPSDEKIIVLAVDDNVDLISLYKSYCLGTAYEIEHIKEGQHILEAIEATGPDIIILDVLLPDVDGWDLLLDLHANPATTSIPIIVCSVVTDERLALDLGAVRYLRKPVWRQQLIDTLDQALSRAATESLKGHSSRPRAC